MRAREPQRARSRTASHWAVTAAALTLAATTACGQGARTPIPPLSPTAPLEQVADWLDDVWGDAWDVQRSTTDTDARIDGCRLLLTTRRRVLHGANTGQLLGSRTFIDLARLQSILIRPNERDGIELWMERDGIEVEFGDPRIEPRDVQSQLTLRIRPEYRRAVADALVRGATECGADARVIDQQG